MKYFLYILLITVLLLFFRNQTHAMSSDLVIQISPTVTPNTTTVSPSPIDPTATPSPTLSPAPTATPSSASGNSTEGKVSNKPDKPNSGSTDKGSNTGLIPTPVPDKNNAVQAVIKKAYEKPVVSSVITPPTDFGKTINPTLVYVAGKYKNITNAILGLTSLLFLITGFKFINKPALSEVKENATGVFRRNHAFGIPLVKNLL